MDKPSYKLVGQPCGHQGQYTFYKALRISGKTESIIAIGDFFFVKIWQDSELVSVGELQLLWTDRISDQTLVSLRLYFLPENTPDGRNGHGEHEVLSINELMVIRADDLLSWMCTGEEWHWGLQAVWRSPEAPDPPPAPLHSSKLDFADVDCEKADLEVDISAPGVVVFSYPRYCRYRALVARLEGIQASWLRDSLVAALGGYTPTTQNTRILYCRDTFEYPELEGHEFVCNQLAPKARPRARRRRHHYESEAHVKHLQAPRRLRNESDTKSDSEGTPHADESNPHPPSLHGAARAENKAFIKQLKSYHSIYHEKIKLSQRVRAIPLVTLYSEVKRSGGFNKTSWDAIARALPPYTASYLSHVYQRYLLAYENFERHNGAGGVFQNGVFNNAQATIVTETISDESPDREIKPFKPETKPQPNQTQLQLETKPPAPQSPQSHTKTYTQTNTKAEYNHTSYDPSNLLNLNTETGETEPVSIDPKTDSKLKTDSKISVKSVDKLLEPVGVENGEVGGYEGKGNVFLDHLAQKFNLVNPDTILSANPCPADVSALSALSGVSDKYTGGAVTNGPTDQRSTQKSTTRSSLRSVRVKPALKSSRVLLHSANSSDNSTASGPRPDSASSSPPTFIQPTNLTTTPQNPTQDLPSDDEIIEVPYKPKTPEIIDLDEYPESPENNKKKKIEKLDLLKERGLEVTSLPGNSNWNFNALNTRLLGLNPQQIITPAQIFQVYPTMPPYTGVPPKIVQGKSIYGSSGIEKTVYGNPKDPYMPPPHIIHGAPVKPNKNLGLQPTSQTKQDILDLTCKNAATVKPAVEIVRIPTPKSSQAQNLSKNYTLLDGKAVVGSNLEITLVNPKSNTPVKQKNQKRSSNGQFVSLKTPTPPKEQKPSTSGFKPKPNIVIPSYQPSRDTAPSPIPNQAPAAQNPNLMNMYKDPNITQLMEMQAKQMGNVPFMDPVYMGALYTSLAGQFDQRQLAFYRDLMANQFRSYSGLLNLGVSSTPTTKN